jgi:hypothetical protein
MELGAELGEGCDKVLERSWPGYVSRGFGLSNLLASLSATLFNLDINDWVNTCMGLP